MRLVGWIVNPVSSFDAVHQPIGWQNESFVIGPHAIDPADFPEMLTHTGATVLWTGKDYVLNPDPTYYDSFVVNALTDGEDQQDLNEKWKDYCYAAQDSESSDSSSSSSDTV
jgi:hypothetical protein